MNTIGYTPAEIKARNDRAREIVASHNASDKEKSRAAFRLAKDEAKGRN